jgi:hypothetical protein
MYSVMWSEHCSYKSSKVHLKQFGEKETPRGKMLAGIGENAGVDRHRSGLCGHVQGRVAQPPVVRRALPGCGHRRRRHRPRHPGDGRRPVAVMDPLRFGPLDAPTPNGCCPASSPASAATATAWACPTSAARRLRRDLPRQPAGQRAVRRRPAPRGPAPGQGVAERQQGDPLRRGHRRRRHRRRVGSGQSRPSRDRTDQAAQRPGRRPVHGEAPHRVHARGLQGRRRRRHPGPRRRRALVRDQSELASAGDGGMHVDLDLVPLRDPTLSPERS